MSETQVDADQLQWLQQEGGQQTAPSLGHAALPRVRLSHVTVKKQPASTFEFTFPQAVQAAEAKQAAKVSMAGSENRHEEGPQGFVLKFADPKPAAQPAATAAAQGAPSSAEAESSTADGRPAPHKAATAGQAKSDKAPEYIQLPACEQSLIESYGRGCKLVCELPASKASAGHGKQHVTAEKLGEYADCLRDGHDKYPQKLQDAVHRRTKELLVRAQKLCEQGRHFGTPHTLHACPYLPHQLSNCLSRSIAGQNAEYALAQHPLAATAVDRDASSANGRGAASCQLQGINKMHLHDLAFW